MAERPLDGSVMTIRKGQTVLPTECVCGAKMRNPTLAAAHAKRRGLKHFTLRQQAENDGSNPPSPPAFDTTFGGRFPVPEHLVCSVTCLDRGDSRASTPCLCNCHYQGPTARRMIKEAGDAED